MGARSVITSAAAPRCFSVGSRCDGAAVEVLEPLLDQGAEHVYVYIGESLDVQARRAGGVWTQPGHQLGVLDVPFGAVERLPLIADGQSLRRPVALPTRGVPVLVLAEVDDARTPHRRVQT